MGTLKEVVEEGLRKIEVASDAEMRVILKQLLRALHNHVSDDKIGDDAKSDVVQSENPGAAAPGVLGCVNIFLMEDGEQETAGDQTDDTQQQDVNQ